MKAASLRSRSIKTSASGCRLRTELNRARVALPPYYPDTPKTREDWGRYLDNISAMDLEVQDILTELREDGLEDETIIFFWSDHGVGLPRAKRWLYDSGTLIPLIIKAPPRWIDQLPNDPGTDCDELVSSLDFAPTVLRLAGTEPPAHMQGLRLSWDLIARRRDSSSTVTVIAWTNARTSSVRCATGAIAMYETISLGSRTTNT